jgi:hypothetical protein
VDLRQSASRPLAVVLWAGAAILAGTGGAWGGPGNGADPEYPVVGRDGRRLVRPQDTPDIVGPGKVATCGNMWVKTTNIGVIGNPFTASSSDPSAQWPGASGVEHMFFAGFWVGAKDATVSDPALLRRVSHNTEWRPPSLAPEDRIYITFEGQSGGARLSDDDGDSAPGNILVDEDRLDGHDNDNDGRVDEDYEAISQQMFTCILRDDTPQATEAAFAEKHVPRYLEVQQNSYCFSVPGANDFSSFEFIIENVGPNVLDSVFVAFQVDQDVGPLDNPRYFSDDLADPRFPQGPDYNISMDFDDPNNPNAPFLETIAGNDPRYQFGLCTRDTIFVHGFSTVDDDGDMGKAPSASSFLLLGHTIDPTGQKAPQRVGFRFFKWFQPGTPPSQGGFPTNDQERYQIISSTANIDPVTGQITQENALPGEGMDYFELCSVGPFLNFQPGEKIRVSVAVAAQLVNYSRSPDDLWGRYRACILNAIDATKTYRGGYELRQDLPSPTPGVDFGRETPLVAPPGQIIETAKDCHDDSTGAVRIVRDSNFPPTWFDFDCNYCTGVAGMVQKRWLASAPPPSPRMYAEPGDRSIAVLWDNLSEYTPDPAKGFYDFKGYKVWKAANWTRPVGSTGPGDELWALIGTFYYYDEFRPLIEYRTDCDSDPDLDTCRTANVFLNRLTGQKIYPDSTIDCLPGPYAGNCDAAFADKPILKPNGQDTTLTNYQVNKYPIGRYRFTDPNVLNGLVYFYSVTAFDSTGKGSSVTKLEGRPAAVEQDAVLPQASLSNPAVNDGKVYVVPNPYYGSSEWDLTPSASDPTGTHVDFFNMPPGQWVLRIYTAAGDLVQEIRSTDSQSNGRLQQETPLDGQASWNLVSRNGQEVVSGIYLFSVEVDGNVQQGKFVLIR